MKETTRSVNLFLSPVSLSGGSVSGEGREEKKKDGEGLDILRCQSRVYVRIPGGFSVRSVQD